MTGAYKEPIQGGRVLWGKAYFGEPLTDKSKVFVQIVVHEDRSLNIDGTIRQAEANVNLEHPDYCVFSVDNFELRANKRYSLRLRADIHGDKSKIKYTLPRLILHSTDYYEIGKPNGIS